MKKDEETKDHGSLIILGVWGVIIVLILLFAHGSSSPDVPMTVNCSDHPYDIAC